MMTHLSLFSGIGGLDLAAEAAGFTTVGQVEWAVAMVIKMWRPGYKRQASRETDYRSQGRGYQLNYCPECGKKLKER